ncbi:MAG: type II secretion system protein [Dehalococcoidia bacterium]|jgi:prepilin-type N-terminal cleavage/methylation domain-containing protein
MIIYKKGKAGTNWSAGFTLIELIVTLSIMGAVSAIMAMTFSEATKLTSSDMAQAIVLAQVHQAGESIAKDVASADNITAGSTGTWTCSMVCYQWQQSTSTFISSSVTYTISNGQLLRNGVIIAQYIVNPGSDTLFTKVTPTGTENNTYVLTVKAVKNNASFSKAFKIYQRIP